MVLAVGALLFPIINRYTYHPGETVIVLMPPVLGAVLWILWPSVRRIPWWHHALYLAFLIAVIAAAITFAAHMARGRVLWIEVFWTVYFAVGWRLAWAIWRRTVGRLGERRRRWARRCRRSIRVTGHQPTAPQRRALLAARFISPARALAVVLVFIPLFFGSMIHRMKIGNPPDPAAFTDLDVEPVSFITADGLLLDGWFVPNGDSDDTVIICHGLGANKGNFAEFLQLFRGPGYNSLIFDFRGHGDSAGHTTTFGLYGDRDVRAAVDWLKSARPERARHVLGIGSSMGAMSLVRAAANDPRIEAVVLDSCCLSAPRLAEQHLGVIPVIGPLYGKVLLAVLSLNAGRSLWDLDLGDAIARLSPRPVLLIQGEDDIIIPPANLELLYKRAGEPKEKWLAPGPHSNILTTDFAQYQARVQHFFDRALGRETRNAP
jgi:fermentation-respiration switch protein FrsA (DUF1100 family)